ncbi:branched-subunit amino acid ABC-type transport system permease component [Marmoricola sp. OAE513]|uniref:hypothetical protein n=1 Tax=Marmoricola sp. OAE513 TaxID=2817894 RepID=UPI001AEB0389
MRRLTANPWLIPLLGCWALSWVDQDLVDWVGSARAAAILMGAGMVLGWAWYRFGPRPLAERLYPLAVLLVLGVLLLLGGGGIEVDSTDAGAWTVPGILAGLIFAEAHPSWQAQRRVALSSRRNQPDLRDQVK